MKYLLAAEADKIQEFIFRSSSLREVVGASQLLLELCQTGIQDLMHQHGGQEVVNDGGSFRVLFEDADADAAYQKAERFGADLAELYRLLVDGTLSVAEPVQMNGDFRAANTEADAVLRQAKQHRCGAVAVAHMPYVAFCASCGVALASKHGTLPKEPANRRRRYLCDACRIKAQARWDTRLPLLRNFRNKVVQHTPNLDEFDWPQDADDVARYDLRQRNYVAYLVADGNGMGSIFSTCDRDQIQKLSKHLTDTVETSLAAPTGQVMGKLPWQHNKDRQTIVPVLPLIIGGDDLFALLPAPYALDFARRFCLAYEQHVGALVKGVLGPDAPRPTVAAAVVICKRKYPYTLAHRRAEALLAHAKRQCKLLAAETGERLSAVNFEVILGNRLASEDDQPDERKRAVQTSLRPYWVANDDNPLSEDDVYGVDLCQLTAQRLHLKDVPNTRLAELRRRFETLPNDIEVINGDEKLEQWTRELTPLLKRSGKQASSRLDKALTNLGQPATGQHHHHWRELERDGSTSLANGMLDLLAAWDFALDLDHTPDEYESEEITE